MNNKTIFVLFITLLSSINLVNAQSQYLFGFNGGISKATGEAGDVWDMGFTFSGEWFSKGTENIYTGWRIAYNRWSPNENELRGKYYNGYGLIHNISGSATLIEILPSIRFISSATKNQQTQFFGQISFGYYIIDSDIKMTISYNSNFSTISIKSSTYKKFGVNLGAGLIIKGTGNTKIIIYPMYNIIPNPGQKDIYLTINAGFLFGK